MEKIDKNPKKTLFVLIGLGIFLNAYTQIINGGAEILGYLGS